MKHRIAGRRLDRTTEHRVAMFKNMVTSLLRHERIETTTPKAKELKRIADKVITLGKKGTPHARRRAYVQVRDVEVLNKLFDSIGPRYAARAGGYTRVVRLGRRLGDNAEVSVVELVEKAPAEKPAEEGKAAKAEPKGKAPAKPRAEKAPKAEAKPKAEKKPKKEKAGAK
jgi:large subunit ribosomal protein L17